ncbi:alpha/beta hydrolase [Undibacterium sp.]|jgi:pimeloyl-ACP methyl ester carboxylesterase|uniref:alpha/beta fold hydrolase n=1 Tax=Undibacterium sp. TaxID=1914977 RepID=UPI002BB6D6DD|nr:alpha/beta hydrolase [Undibacterium sp.]HTD04552.1 alpha/beta hydrolase [Undibacterium sp.]
MAAQADSPHADQRIQFADLHWCGRPISLEYQWVGASKSDYPVVVFLHEGLGSISLWKDFPEQFCTRHGFTGLVFSRYAYGRSTARPAAERFPVDFMQRQALEVLPLFLQQVGVEKPWLFGHSDGGSIALLYAAQFPDRVSGIVVVAPHIFVEDMTVAAIRVAREAYLGHGLRERLARHHSDVDSAFWGWNDVWLDPAFRAWNIEDRLAGISGPVLAIQGENDEYGTLAQIGGIQKKVPHAVLKVIPKCGHSPHRDQPDALGNEAGNFIKTV